MYKFACNQLGAKLLRANILGGHFAKGRLSRGRFAKADLVKGHFIQLYSLRISKKTLLIRCKQSRINSINKTKTDMNFSFIISIKDTVRTYQLYTAPFNTLKRLKFPPPRPPLHHIFCMLFPEIACKNIKTHSLNAYPHLII